MPAPLHQLMPFLYMLICSYSAFSHEYKVGDLNAWGLPPPSNSRIYSLWSQNYNSSIGDSLMFLYPPSEDSVIQVTRIAFSSCVISNPIRKMSDGNSLFNITSAGYFYFTSGVPGHCQKGQKVVVAVPLANGTFLPPTQDSVFSGSPSAGVLPASSPMSSNVFSPIAQPSVGATPAAASIVVLVGAAIAAGVHLWF